MKATPISNVIKPAGRKSALPRRMNRRLAEERAVGDVSKPKFDGVVLLRGLKT